MRDGLGFQLSFASSRCAAMNAGLEIAVHVFIRVQFGRVGWQVEHVDPVLVLGQPGLDYLGVMNTQIVENQEYLAPGVLDQTLHEVDQDAGIHRAIEDTEADIALIGDGRDQVDGLPFCVQADDGCLSLGRIAPTMLAVTAMTGLAAPVDLGILPTLFKSSSCISWRIGGGSVRTESPVFLQQPGSISQW